MGRVQTLLLARHGATAWNESGYCQGRRDVPLSAAGRRQAQALRDALVTRRLHGVHASPLARAIETARIVSGEEPRTIADLAEIDRGHWEGHAMDEIRRRWGKLHDAWYDDPAGLAMPGGERFDDLWARAGRVLDLLARSLNDLAAAGREGATLFACGHKAINRVLIARALGLPSRGVWRIPQPQASLTVLLREGDRWREERIADVAHLPPDLRSDS